MNASPFDAIIIGAGVAGCACARELSRYTSNIAVVEAAEDVCCGTSKANSAIVHAGFDAQPGSVMAELNVQGNALFPQLSTELEFGFAPIGSLVVCTDAANESALEDLKARGEKNGVPGLRIIGREELVSLEPNISDDATAALLAPTGGICDPFGMTVALAENAAQNGCQFFFNAPVTSIHKVEDESGTNLWRLVTAGGELLARTVVNAAGVHADEIHNMVAAADDQLTIIPRRGEYELLDTTAGSHVSHTVFMLPTAMGKGVLVTPTIHGNLLVGPTADDIEDKSDTATTPAGIRSVVENSALTIKDIPFRETITSFSGLRAHLPEHDFRIGEVAGARNFVDCAGIESPGLTASPAIGLRVAGIVADLLGKSVPRADFEPCRKGFANLNTIDEQGWNDLIAMDPSYGTIVCRCCRVSEGQIREACRRIPCATSVDGVKRRVGATMGRCQGGFCSPRIMEIISEELGIPLCEVTKAGPGSAYASGTNKDIWEDADEH